LRPAFWLLPSPNQSNLADVPSHQNNKVGKVAAKEVKNHLHHHSKVAKVLAAHRPVETKALPREIKLVANNPNSLSNPVKVPAAHRPVETKALPKEVKEDNNSPVKVKEVNPNSLSNPDRVKEVKNHHKVELVTNNPAKAKVPAAHRPVETKALPKVVKLVANNPAKEVKVGNPNNLVKVDKLVNSPRAVHVVSVRLPVPRVVNRPNKEASPDLVKVAREEMANSLNPAKVAREEMANSLNPAKVAREEMVNSLNQAKAVREGMANSLNQAKAVREGMANSLNQAKVDREGMVNNPPSKVALATSSETSSVKKRILLQKCFEKISLKNYFL
jgi:hypothetical protein